MKEGSFYNLYHGFMEARPVTAKTSKILYTLMLDVSDKADKAAKSLAVSAAYGEGSIQILEGLEAVRVEHFHDMGKLLFTGTCAA